MQHLQVLAKFLFIITCGYLLVLLALFSLQRRMIYFPTASLVENPGSLGLNHEEVWLTNRLGTTIHGWYVHAAGERAAGCLLFLHGNAGNIGDRLPSIALFTSLGLDVLIIDYSGYGRSGGSPSEAALLADARSGWDWLRHERQWRPQDIVLFGRSLGGGVAAGLAGELAAAGVMPAALLLESTFTSLVAVARAVYPWLPVRHLLLDRFTSQEALAAVRTPALVIHSRDDEVIPYQLGRELFAAYSGPKRFLELTGDHNSGYLLSGGRYREQIASFLKEHTTLFPQRG